MKNKQAFTLIELLVVVLIIGILAAVALPQYQKAVLKSRFAQAKILAHSIAQAEQAYFMANGEYGPLDELDIEMGGTPQHNSVKDVSRSFSWGSCNVESLTDEYSPKVVCYILGKIRYDEHLNSTTRKCVALSLDNSSVQHQVCQNETNRKTPNSCTESANYCVYIY